jgi:hypothetical protein
MPTTVTTGTPYITPDVLLSEPTGISWKSIPYLGASPKQQLDEQMNICMRATAEVDEFVQTVLRATIDTELVNGPGDIRCQLRGNGVARVVLSRPPVTSVISAQSCAPGQFPPVYTTIPVNKFKIELPLLGVYGTTAPSAGGDTGGQSILVAPGYFTWARGRYGIEMSVVYANGWPHASLTAAAIAGATTLAVDDITSWTGANAILYDPNFQEAITCTTVTPNTVGALSGPGTLTLAAGLAYAHTAGRLVTALPSAAMDATVLYATNQALRRGATAINVASAAARESTAGHPKIDQNMAMAEVKLLPFRRVL